MKLGRALASVAVATSLLTAPVAAQAAAPARVSSDVDGEQLRGGFIIPVIALIAIILGILAATHDKDDDLPHSP